MGKVSTIGLDLAKEVFQVHGTDAVGAVVFRKRLRRTAVLQFFAAQAASLTFEYEVAGRFAVKLAERAHFVASERVNARLAVLNPPNMQRR
jgi:transposase